MLKIAIAFLCSAAVAGPLIPRKSDESGTAVLTLLVSVPADCECVAQVIGAYSQQPTTIYCGQGAEPCISWLFEKSAADTSNSPGNCGISGEPPCGTRSSCSYTAYKVTAQLASCITSCGVAPFRAFNEAGAVGKKLQNPGDKESIAVMPTDVPCGAAPAMYHFEVRDSSSQGPAIMGRYTLTVSCADCTRPRN